MQPVQYEFSQNAGCKRRPDCRSRFQPAAGLPYACALAILSHVCVRASPAGTECHVYAAMHTPLPIASLKSSTSTRVPWRLEAAHQQQRVLSATWHPASPKGSHQQQSNNQSKRCQQQARQPISVPMRLLNQGRLQTLYCQLAINHVRLPTGHIQNQTAG